MSMLLHRERVALCTLVLLNSGAGESSFVCLWPNAGVGNMEYMQGMPVYFTE